MERYEGYNRQASAVYVGEYAAHERDRKSTLRSALAEAAAMTGFERNGDIVRLVSYTPLLAKRGQTQWVPDLIYFDNTRIFSTINYVQQLFGANTGDVTYPINIGTEAQSELAASCVRSSRSGDLIRKIVSRSTEQQVLDLDLSGFPNIETEALCTVLSGDELAENAFGTEPAIVPETFSWPVAQQFSHEIPAYSVTVLRIKPLHA